MPRPLFTKLVSLAAIGFFCVLFGCIYGLHTKDRIFLIMSILIGLCILVRSLDLYHLIHSHAYVVLTGFCCKREPGLFQKKQQIVFTTLDAKEYHFTFDKNVKIMQGRCYHLYFRITDSISTDETHGFPASQNYLGVEEISSIE
ncbi:MAG: hypothetical protein PHG16_11835 [Lachnospiraceae bacterium]|nr:hypothetical protein [Lachnospiraceae bacterium]